MKWEKDKVADPEDHVYAALAGINWTKKEESMLWSEWSTLKSVSSASKKVYLG